MSSTVVAGPASSAARSTAAMGTSRWTTSTAAELMKTPAASTSAAVRAALAPGATTMAFSPSGVTVTKADPVAACAVVATSATSTP